MPCRHLSRLWSEGVSGGCAMGFLYNYTEKTYMPRSGFSLNFTRVPLFSGKNIPAANTRVLRGLRKCLSVSGLHFPTIRSASHGIAKWPISQSDMGHFVLQYALYRALIKPISGCNKAHFAKQYGFSCRPEGGKRRGVKEYSGRNSPFRRNPFSILRKNFVKILYCRNCINIHLCGCRTLSGMFRLTI